MSTRFEAGRSAYKLLSAALKAEPDLRADIERAFDLVLSRYSTKLRENRFIVGGVVERIIAAAYLALGHKALNAGVRVTRSDILVRDTALSIKGAFRLKSGAGIRLVNVMGASKGTAWNEPTIFVVSGMGMGYADPDLLPNATTRASDAIVLRRKPLLDLWKHDAQWLTPMNVPGSREDESGSDVASRVIADEILRYGMKRLRPFDPRTPDQ